MKIECSILEHPLEICLKILENCNKYKIIFINSLDFLLRN